MNIVWVLWFFTNSLLLLASAVGVAVLMLKIDGPFRTRSLCAHQWWFTTAVGAVASALRTAVLWFLMLRQWTGTADLGTVPLLLLIYPEAAMLPTNANVSITDATLCSIALILDSFAVVFSLAAIVKLASWAACRIGRRITATLAEEATKTGSEKRTREKKGHD
jgi:hypothetical protein